MSLSLAFVKKFPLSSLAHYMAGQYLGAFLGSALVLLTYRDALHHFSGGNYVVAGENATAGIFTTFPAEGVTNFGGAIDQVGRYWYYYDFPTPFRWLARPSSCSLSVP